MLLDLLRRPRTTIPGLYDQIQPQWPIPLAGYFFTAFAESYGRMVERFAHLPGFGLVALVAIATALVGMWAWAGMLGGALYLSVRLLKGRHGFHGSVMAVGYGLFWPGLLGFLSSILVILGGFRGGEVSASSMVGIVGQLASGVWGLYTLIAAIKAHHGFGWWRAIASYVIPGIVLFLGASAYFLIAAVRN